MYNEINLIPIGLVKRLVTEENVKDKNLITKIILRDELVDALVGIEDFSHVFIIFWLHKTAEDKRDLLKVHPRGRKNLPLVGIFSTRTPNRPNPIGLSLVELVKRDGNVLWVKGLDAFEDTPVLDIKPFDHWDRVKNYKIPRWLAKICKSR